MHKEKVKTFRCGRCNTPFKTENTQINHEKTFGGARAEREEKRKCEKCGKDYSKNNIARHRRACTAREGEGGVRGAVRPGGARGGGGAECSCVQSQVEQMSGMWVDEVCHKHDKAPKNVQRRG